MEIDLEALEAAGLYDPNASSAADQLDLLSYLLGIGASIDQIVEADALGNISSVGVDVRLRQGELSARDLADHSGLALDRVIECYRLLGVPILDLDELRFSPSEVRLMELFSMAEGLLPDQLTDEILRSMGAGMTVIAETSVSAFVGSVEDSLVEIAPQMRAQTTTAAGELAIEMGSLLGPLLRHHIWNSTKRQRDAMEASTDRRQSTVTVGFVDLVGFTATTAAMTSDALLAFMREFHGRTYDIVTGLGGRVIKHIGDEIMFSAVLPESACEIGLELVRSFGDVGSRPRGGLAHGVVLARHGDLYGSVVNLAARLADVAVPGEILTDTGLADAVDSPNLRFDQAGQRQLKGFADPVTVRSLAKAG